MIYSVFRRGNNYHSRNFLEECKYVVKERKISRYIIDNIEISSDFNAENSDKENCNEENSDEKNLDEKYFDGKN